MLGDSVRRRQPQRARPKEKVLVSPRPRSADRWRPLLVGVPIALLAPFLIGYLLAVYVLFPPTEVSGAGIPVPSLIGLSGTDAQRSLAAAGLGPIDVSEQPHPTAAPGQVLAQSPLPGQQLRAGAAVRVAVSSGAPRAPVPDVVGFSATRAESLLRRAGFEVNTVTQESASPAGRVLRTDPAQGQERTLPSLITLVVSAGPAQPLGVAVDTLAAPPDTTAFESR
jgi:hypothetical protein